MKIALISFTGQGAKTCQVIAHGLGAKQYECKAFAKAFFAEEVGLIPLDDSLSHWTEIAFAEADALIFVGACGIAVRAIASFIKSKTLDPAVVVVDEEGRYAISLLSGHLGGANEMTLEVARIIGAEPVITTSTDIRGLFAVDEWAKKQNLWIDDMTMAKEVSVALLEGEEIGVISDYTIEGPVPKQLILYDKEGREKPGAQARRRRLGIRISSFKQEEKANEEEEAAGFFERTLRLVPKNLTIGIGCRKGTPMVVITALLEKTFIENNLYTGAVKQICSIDLKENEEGICQLAEALGVPFRVYSAEELKEVAGYFTPSNFVREITGVDNICERAAVLGSGGQLIIKKQALNGVTLAIAAREEKYKWIQQ